MKRTGFTLIELLVVIAIIAILAAILFPVFARARAKAQQTQCLSNIKQIAMAEKMYTADYQDRWAPWNCDSRYTVLNPYLSQANPTSNTAGELAKIKAGWAIWKCPSAAPPWSTYHVNYGLNDYGDGNYSASWFARAESEIPDPANVIMWGDGGWDLTFTAAGVPNSCNTRVMQGVWWPSTAGIDVGLTNDPPFWPYRASNMQFSFIGRHNGLCNFNFCDGHAKAMDLKQMRAKTISVQMAYFGAAYYSVFYYLCHVRAGNSTL